MRVFIDGAVVYLNVILSNLVPVTSGTRCAPAARPAVTSHGPVPAACLRCLCSAGHVIPTCIYILYFVLMSDCTDGFCLFVCLLSPLIDLRQCKEIVCCKNKQNSNSPRGCRFFPPRVSCRLLLVRRMSRSLSSIHEAPRCVAAP